MIEEVFAAMDRGADQLPELAALKELGVTPMVFTRPLSEEELQYVSEIADMGVEDVDA